MKIRLFSCLLIICCFSVLKCGEDQTEKGGSPLTELPKISNISYGSSWRSSDSSVTDTGRYFDFGITTVYYMIAFDSATANSFMIRKVWQKSDDTLFKPVFMVPYGMKRICGEFRLHDFQALDTGLYRMTVFYVRRDSSGSYYDTASYAEGINKTFRVE